MVQTARRIREYLRIIDVVIEVIDARIPRIGRAPLLDQLASQRQRVIALNRDDLADPATTRRWLDAFAERGAEAVAIDGRMRGSVSRLTKALAVFSREDARVAKMARTMIVGVPNSGKSTIVNALLRRGAAKTEDRAGVTRQLQWFRLAPGVELLDTPGVLPPKVSSDAARWKLAMCGAIARNQYDPAEVASAFHSWLVEQRPRTGVPDLQSFAAARGFIRRGGDVDYHNAAQSYISAFNDGVFGRISLEAPGDAEAA
jgi:ribosome biogenesis GTPase A